MPDILDIAHAGNTLYPRWSCWRDWLNCVIGRGLVLPDCEFAYRRACRSAQLAAGLKPIWN